MVAAPMWVAAQEAPPSGLEAVELARSTACVAVLTELDALDQTLEPLARRSQRLRAVGQAIAFEERSVVDSLNAADPTEAAVRAWFDADLALAQQFVDSGDESINAQRAEAREVIQQTVADAFAALQAEAQEHIQAAGDLSTGSALCEGMILVRSAVLEACQGMTSPLCDAAASDSPGGRYRFVESPPDLWDVSEFRPWSEPGPLQLNASSQIGGARTAGYARRGNVIVNVAFAPLLQEKADLSAEQVARFEGIIDSLGFEFSHPQISFTPSLGLRASLPEAIAGETFYVLHFGVPEEADVIWTGPAGTGAPVVATVPLGPSHVALMASGDPISFTAVLGRDTGDNEAIFSIQFTSVNQERAAQALLGYMSSQLSTDLALIAPPMGEGGVGK